MPLRENIYYWKHSLEHPEPEDLAEEAYTHDQLIVEDISYLANVNRLRDLITTYCTLSKLSGNYSGATQEATHALLPDTDKPHEASYIVGQSILKEIDYLLINVQNIQYTEFAAYFKCLGISHSEYRDNVDEQQRLAVLKKILERYCERRKEQYDRLGYTHVTQQALYDSAASRTKGFAAIQKLRQLIEQVSRELGVTIQEISKTSQFTKSQLGYYVVNEKGFSQVKKALNFRYEYGQKSQGKIPDLMVKIRDRILIIEAKHVREAGGAQDKQINELIQFISQREDKPVSYIAFLDGRYFNKFRESSPAEKVRQQRDSIRSALEEYPSNYFVNTAGLIELLKDILSESAEDTNNQTSRE
jgi:hypothetical protein